MARRKLPEDCTVEGSNMTPMIDIVFQLLIFFMLVTDMAKAQLEPVVLPYASKALKEKFEDTQTIVFNVMKDGSIKAGGKVFYNPKKDDDKALVDIFESRRQKAQYQEVVGKDDWVKYPILIRADRSTPFEHVQRIMMVATKHGGVTRLQLGARKPEGN